MKTRLIAIFGSVFFVNTVFCQTQTDTIFTHRALTPVTIDGAANEDCWATAEWHPMSQVWIPYGATMKAGDFQGRFKVAWDSLYLYLLAEIVDDSLSDDHVSPTQNWWDDDCLEVFIDENRSKGNHEKNNNAFAYHVSIFYDAIDENSSGSGVNYKQNLSVVMDTVSNDTYLWEMAIKNYSASFVLSNPEASRVKLTPNKIMGFTLAYCDNDETTSRENFIGSMYMTAAHANDNYITADYFGTMKLVDDYSDGISAVSPGSLDFKVFPVPAHDAVTISTNASDGSLQRLEIKSITGKVLKTQNFREPMVNVNIDDLDSGVYILSLKTGRYLGNQKFIKL